MVKSAINATRREKEKPASIRKLNNDAVQLGTRPKGFYSGY